MQIGWPIRMAWVMTQASDGAHTDDHDDGEVGGGDDGMHGYGVNFDNLQGSKGNIRFARMTNEG